MADIYTGLLAYTDPSPSRPQVGVADGRVKNYLQHMAAKSAKALTAANTTANEVTVIATHLTTTSGGNYTLTVNIPTRDIVYTTANIAYDDAAATIEAALDTASPATVPDGDINVAESGAAGLSDGNCTFTCNGSANVANMPVLITIADVDLSGSGNGVGAVTRSTAGRKNRYAHQALTELLAVTGATQDAGEEPTLVDNTANAVGWVDRPSLRVIQWLGVCVSTFEEGTPYVLDQLETLFPEIKRIR